MTPLASLDIHLHYRSLMADPLRPDLHRRRQATRATNLRVLLHDMRLGTNAQWYPMVSGAEQLWGHGGAFPILNAVANTAGNIMLLRGAPRKAAVHDACERGEIGARSMRDRDAHAACPKRGLQRLHASDRCVCVSV